MGLFIRPIHLSIPAVYDETIDKNMCQKLMPPLFRVKKLLITNEFDRFFLYLRLFFFSISAAESVVTTSDDQASDSDDVREQEDSDDDLHPDPRAKRLAELPTNSSDHSATVDESYDSGSGLVSSAPDGGSGLVDSSELDTSENSECFVIVYCLKIQ